MSGVIPGVEAELRVVTGTGGPLGPAAAPAFDDFYRREFERQCRRAFLLTGSNEVANDVVHSAMLEMYRRWSTIDEPAAYLSKAVLNRCRDRGRRGRTADRAAHLIAEPVAVPGEPYLATADAMVLDAALAGLPFNHRAAIVLRYYAGLTTPEIAAALDCPVGSVGPFVARGLVRLRAALDPDDFTDAPEVHR